MNRTSTVLTGLALATGVARDAADGVPIVKQVLGVAARVVSLAELIDKNREDLHALADRAKRMDATITAIVADRELAHEVLRRLEALNGVLRVIEKHFVRHIKRSRVRRSLDYVFTVRKEVDRLKGDFDDRLKELELAASMDTNIISRGDSRFIGQFRNIRHCEINLLRRIRNVTPYTKEYTINCHLATCEGSNRIFVVRHIVLSRPDVEWPREIEAGDRIQERLSNFESTYTLLLTLCMTLHRRGHNATRSTASPRAHEELNLSDIIHLAERVYNIAGEACEGMRVVVRTRVRVRKPPDGPGSGCANCLMNGGDIRSLVEVIKEGRAEISVIGTIVAKLADASSHLQKHGATWRAGNPAIVHLDKDYEPQIGYRNDLYVSLEPTEAACAGSTAYCLAWMLDISSLHSRQNQWPHVHRRSTAWCTELFGDLLDAGYRTLCRENLVLRADISNLIPLSRDTWTYLHGADEYRKNPLPMWDSQLHLFPIWGTILLDLAAGRRGPEGSFLRAQYQPLPCGDPHYIEVHCVEYDTDHVYYMMSRFEIPPPGADEIRQRLGIPAGSTRYDDVLPFRMERFVGTGVPPTKGTVWSSVERIYPVYERHGPGPCPG